MKKFLYLCFSLLFMLNASAAIIDGGIEYNQEFSYPSESYIFEHLYDKNTSENIMSLKQGITKLKDREIGEFSDGTYGIMYYDNPEYSWYYTKEGRLVNFTQKSSLTYPIKITKYKPDGRVINTGVKLSKAESLIYNNDGILIAHWIGNICYDKNNNIIMTRKIY